MRWLLLVCLHFASQSVFAGPSLVSFLSQKTNEIRNLQMCQEANKAEHQALTKKGQTCNSSADRKNWLSIDDANENLFFDQGARKQIEGYDCLTEQTDQFLQKQNSPAVEASRETLAKDFALKIKRISKNKIELESVEDELAEMERSEVTSPMGETMPTTFVDENRRIFLRKRQIELRSGTESILSSLWQGRNHNVREFVLEAAKNKNFDPQKFTADFLQTKGSSSFNVLLSKMRSEVQKDKTLLAAKADGSDLSKAHFRLSDKDKVQLYKDQNWLKSKEIQSQTGHPLSGLMCRLDGRYGIGRDRFYTAAEVTVAVGLTLLPGGLYLAAGRGLIALSAAQTLTLATAVGISVPALALTYEQRCPQSDLSVSMQGSCQTPGGSLVQEIEHGNCALDVALSALDVPFPELKTAGLIFGSVRLSKVGKVMKRAAESAKEEASNLNNAQTRIWKAREAGRLSEARAVEKAVRDTLENGKMTVLEKTGQGVSRSFYVEFENGVQGVWKPAVGKDINGKAEIAASKVDQYLGTNIVPVTVPKELSGIEGTVQLRVTDLKKVEIRDDPDALAYFDYLIGNADRHGGNVLLNSENKAVAIDHGKTFASKPTVPQIPKLEKEMSSLSSIQKQKKQYEDLLKKKRDQGLSENSNEIVTLKDQIQGEFEKEVMKKKQIQRISSEIAMPKEIIDRIRQTSRQDWENLLGKELSTQQLDQMVQRQNQILNLMDRVEQTTGTAYLPKGRVWPHISGTPID